MFDHLYFGHIPSLLAFWLVSNEISKEIKHFLSDPTDVTALQFSPEGNWLAVGHRDGQVQVLQLNLCIQQPHGHRSSC